LDIKGRKLRSYTGTDNFLEMIHRINH
jgi:hypothetical protein